MEPWGPEMSEGSSDDLRLAGAELVISPRLLGSMPNCFSRLSPEAGVVSIEAELLLSG